MLEITAILTAAAVVYALCRATRIPEVPLLVIAGLGLAMVGQIPTFEVLGVAVEIPELMPDRDFVIGMLQVGLAFLVFVAGLEMAPSRVGDKSGLALKVGLVQFSTLGLLVAWMTLRLGYGVEESLYVALAISASSTLVVVRLLKRRREMFKSFGRMIIGVLLLQDLLVIAALILLSALSESGDGITLMSLEVAMMMGAVTVLLNRLVMPRLIEHYREDEEKLLLIVLATLFAFIGAAYVGDVPMVAGAFFAGLSMSGFPARSLVRGLMSSLSDFFVVVFFISLGALLQLPSGRAVIEAGAIIAMVLLITPLIVAFVAERAGMTSRGALEAGLLLAQTSEFSLVVALFGWELGVLSDDLFAVIVLVTVVTMTVTPLWSGPRFVRWLMQFHPNPGPKEGARERSNHVVIIGGGTAGSLLAKKLQSSGHQPVVIDNDPMVTVRFRERQCGAVWGDAEESKTLREAGVQDAKAVVVTTGSLRQLQAAKHLTGDSVPIWVHVFDEEQARAAAEMGAETIIYSQAATQDFMRWFQKRYGDTGAPTGLRVEDET